MVILSTLGNEYLFRPKNMLINERIVIILYVAQLLRALDNLTFLKNHPLGPCSLWDQGV